MRVGWILQRPEAAPGMKLLNGQSCDIIELIGKFNSLQLTALQGADAIWLSFAP
jgi:hypothetical protein